MAIESAWQPLTRAAVDALPDAMAVFELGSLVRSVLYIGGDPNEGLRAAVTRALAEPRLRLRARCFRWELSSDPRGRAAELLARYRAAHGGSAPAEQPHKAPSVRVFLPHAESQVAVAAPRATLLPARSSDAPVTFLRVRTVA